MTPQDKLWAEEFWLFSLYFYDRPKVADACLQLQNNYQVNVNVLLLTLWCYSQNIGVSKAMLTHFRHAIVESDNALKHHRQLRQSCQFGNKAHYKTLKAIELELERRQQQFLIEQLLLQPKCTKPAHNQEVFLHGYGLTSLPEAKGLVAFLFAMVEAEND
jgi:uncharacterized protein (TIGR02444 family)